MSGEIRNPKLKDTIRLYLDDVIELFVSAYIKTNDDTSINGNDKDKLHKFDQLLISERRAQFRELETSRLNLISRP